MGKKTGILTVGDPVEWRGSWGKDMPKTVTVEGIEQTRYENEKEGDSVNSVKWTDSFIVDLDNGHWAYNHQLKEIS